jgi:NitT/TauT family transport system ATP-binding protein
MDEPFSALDEFTKEKLNEDSPHHLEQKPSRPSSSLPTTYRGRVPLRRVVVLCPIRAASRRWWTSTFRSPGRLAVKDTPAFSALVAKVRGSFEGV